MGKIYYKSFILLFIVIINLLFFSTIGYSQNNNIVLSVMTFDNSTGLTKYDYLKSLFQISIYRKLIEIEDVEVISNEISSKIEKSINFGLKTLQNRSKAIKYFLKTGANIFIKGTFSVDTTSSIISVSTYTYSLSEGEIIYSFSSKSSIDMIDYLCNEISLVVKTDLIKRKEQFARSLEAMNSKTSKIEYIKQPEIEIYNNDIAIEWITNVETSSILCFGDTMDFKASDSLFFIEDLSINATHHYVLIDQSIMKSDVKYYYKSFDMNILKETRSSNFNQIRKSEIDNINITKKTNYSCMESHLNELIHKADEYFSCGKYDIAVIEYEQALEMINKYNLDSIFSTDELKKKLELLFSLMKADEFLSTSHILVQEGKFEEAILKLNELITLITSNNLENYYSVTDIKKMIANLPSDKNVLNGTGEEVLNIDDEDKKAVTVDINYDESHSKDYNDAISLYIKSKCYIQIGVGAGFIELGSFYDGNIIPCWDLSINFRFNRFFSLGIGMNLLYPDIFFKLSLPFFHFEDNIYTELYLKTGCLFGFIPLSFEIGGLSSIGYMLRFNSVFGIFTEFEFFVLYYFDNNETFYSFNFKVGIVLNF